MLAGIATDISQQVLRTDVAGMPLEWIDYREAARLYHQDQVAYTSGSPLYRLFGGFRSEIPCYVTCAYYRDGKDALIRSLDVQRKNKLN